MTTKSSDNNLGLVFWVGIGMVMIIALLAIVMWIQALLPGGRSISSAGTQFDFYSGQAVRLTPTPIQPTTAPVEVAAAQTTGLDEAVAAINKGGCIACHTIPDVPGAVGQIGPDLSQIGLAAATRREGYSAEQYIRESIQDPGAFLAPECPTGPCPAGVMPVVDLTQTELDSIVNYLTTLK